MSTLLSVLAGACGGVAGAALMTRATARRTRGSLPTLAGPVVPGEQHPPSCVCKGQGWTDHETPCPMVWRKPADRLQLVGRLPRGSQR